jgi:iron complex transport system permease protein
MIGFVGLVVPHVLRLIFGPDHRLLLPGAFLGGAAFLVLSDLISRLIITPNELPVGVVTALVGGPFFLYLLRRRGASHGWV